MSAPDSRNADEVPVRAWRARPGHEVCICGIGSRTPLGFDAASSAAAVRAAVSAVAVHPSFLDSTGDPVCLARDAELDPAVPVVARLQALLASAIGDALGVLGSGMSVPCWLGLPQARPGLEANALKDIGRTLAERCGLPLSSVRVLPNGHAAGLMSIQAAAEQISAGHLDVCVVAAADSYHNADSLRWLESAGRLMNGESRNGFPPGEAAAACVLASTAAARRHGWQVLALVGAVATAVEPEPLGSEAATVGLGLTAAVRGVTASLAPAELITATYCDLNGERHRNDEFAYTLLRTQLSFEDAHDYLCPADCWGDVGAASGPLYAALAIAAAERGYAKGTRPMMWSGSDSGYRTAMLLSLPDRAGTVAAGVPR